MHETLSVYTVRSPLLVTPVPLHHEVPPGAHLANFAATDSFARLVYEFHLDMWLNTPNR